MPKGKGAAGALQADEESVREAAEKVQREQGEETVRINISLPKSVLFAGDRRVLSRKEKGESLNRSSYIAELITKDVEP
jgi:hypothetical protein